MVKGKKNRLILLAAGIFITTAFSSCGKEKSLNKSVDTIDLGWYINYSWFSTSCGESEVSKAITEATGAKINFQVPKGNEAEKLNAMIAADTLPDLVTVEWSESQNNDMIEKGQVYALNELADKYDPDFYKQLDEAVVKWYEQKDGNIYGYPNSFYTPEDYLKDSDIPSNLNFLVRKDIYEAIGKPDMTTPDGFAKAVKKASELYKEVNGEPMIPIGAAEFKSDGSVSFGAFLQCFLAIPYEKNGEYYDRNTDKEYLRWLRAFRQLGEEGYLRDEIFIDKRKQLSNKLEKGQYFCLIYQSSDIINQQRKRYEETPEQIYIAAEGPRNSKGDQPELPIGGGIYGWTVTYIAKNCKDPEKALELLKYLISTEGQKLAYLGVEGSMYDMADGKPEIKPDVKKVLFSDRNRYGKRYGGDNTYWMLKNDVVQKQWKEETDFVVRQMEEWTYPYTVYTSQYSIHFGSDLEGANLHKQQQNLWGEVLPQLLLAESEAVFDNILEEYKKTRIEKGYERYKEKVTELYQINKKKMGLQDEKYLKKSKTKS